MRSRSRSRHRLGAETLEHDVRKLLHELSEDLCQAIGESPVVGAKLAELHEAGYSLNLLLDCRQHEDEDEPLFEEPLAEASLTAEPIGQSEPSARNRDSRSRQPVQFRIDAEDLAFLRSVGIDPTRPARSRSTRDPAAAAVPSPQTDPADAPDAPAQSEPSTPCSEQESD